MLDEQIRECFKQHIQNGGLITAPEKLLDAVLKEIAQWLKSHEREYRAADAAVEAEALRDLRVNDLKES